MEENTGNLAPEPLPDAASDDQKDEHSKRFLDAYRRPMKYQFQEPFKWGTGEVTEMEMKPTAGAFQGFSMHMDADGAIDFKPYDLAALCMKMAGFPESATRRLSVQDMNILAQHGLCFFGLYRSDGRKP